MAQPQKKYTAVWWKTHFNKVFIWIFNLGLWLFGLSPFTQIRYVYHVFVSSWIVNVLGVLFYAFYHHNDTDDITLDGVISSLLFVAQVIAHIIILLESVQSRKHRASITTKFNNIVDKLEASVEATILRCDCFKSCDKDNISTNFANGSFRISITILGMLLLLSMVQVFISKLIHTQCTNATEFYWYSMLSSFALKLRSLELLSVVVALNSVCHVVQNSLNTLGEHNLNRILNQLNYSSRSIFDESYSEDPKSSTVNDDAEEQLVQILKEIYTDTYGLLQTLNKSYGWSILAFTAVYFIDFVCNSYWILLTVLTSTKSILSQIHHVGFIMSVLVLLSVLCWHCQNLHNYSRQIGCHIFKLVKPLGNKRYNDLVNEFSLQTLHQQFIITAKHFFALNLNLLGSMVAAIVTYLVILIQFMLSEIAKEEREEQAKQLAKASWANLTKNEVIVQ